MTSQRPSRVTPLLLQRLKRNIRFVFHDATLNRSKIKVLRARTDEYIVLRKLFYSCLNKQNKEQALPASWLSYEIHALISPFIGKCSAHLWDPMHWTTWVKSFGFHSWVWYKKQQVTCACLRVLHDDGHGSIGAGTIIRSSNYLYIHVCFPGWWAWIHKYNYIRSSKYLYIHVCFPGWWALIHKYNYIHTILQLPVHICVFSWLMDMNP